MYIDIHKCINRRREDCPWLESVLAPVAGNSAVVVTNEPHEHVGYVRTVAHTKYLLCTRIDTHVHTLHTHSLSRTHICTRVTHAAIGIDTYTDTDIDRDSDTDTDTKINRDTEQDVEIDSDIDSDTDTDTDVDEDTDTQVHTHRLRHTHTHMHKVCHP